LDITMHIRVGGTVTLVAVVTALGFLLIALAYLLAERRVDGAFQRMDRAFSVATEVQSTRVAVLSARQYEQTYWAFPKQDDRTYQQNLVQAAIENLDQVAGESPLKTCPRRSTRSSQTCRGMGLCSQTKARKANREARA